MMSFMCWWKVFQTSSFNAEKYKKNNKKDVEISIFMGNTLVFGGDISATLLSSNEGSWNLICGRESDFLNETMSTEN